MLSFASIVEHPKFLHYLFTLLFSKLSIVYFIVYLLSNSPRKPEGDELKYMTIDKNGNIIKEKLPTKQQDNIKLSVIVPSFNETDRILLMLEDAISYLQKNLPNQWEIIVVDDGSTDGTSNYCLKLSHERFDLEVGQLRVIRLVKNRGKGGAVRQGMMHIRGEYGLFADADGASKFADISKLLKNMEILEDGPENHKKVPAISVGSRAHMVTKENDAVIKRLFLRRCLMKAFHSLVFLFGIRTIRDTQCGFKLFNRPAIDLIFPYIRTEGWIFDVEMFILAFKKNIPIKETPISWHEVGGSKMHLKFDSLMMAKDLVVIRLSYILGIYKPNKKC